MDCSPDVLTDSYIDEIHALLLKNIQDVGIPLRIKRTPSANQVDYVMSYSSGIVVKLTLHLSNMQIELVGYSFDETKTQGGQPAQVAQTVFKQTADGFNIIENFNDNKMVAQLNSFLEKVAKANLGDFKLVGAEFRNGSNLFYRLNYELTALNLVQTVYIQVGANSYQLIDSNYSSAVLSSPLSLQAIDSLTILDDVWLHKINNIIMAQYGNLLGRQPSIHSIAQRAPFYKISYQTGTSTYTFMILYDYLQNRII